MNNTTRNKCRIKSSVVVLLLTCLVTIANAANVALVPKTGQTTTLPLTAPANSDGALQKGQAWPTPRFVADASGNCITDQLTGLMWVKDLNTVNSGAALNWSTGLLAAANGSWCGHTDWRMPNINELRSLLNFAYADQSNWLMYGSGNSGSPACSGACFANVQARSYWSSSSYASSVSDAWFVNMANGGITTIGKGDSSNFRLFPVRGGQ